VGVIEGTILVYAASNKEKNKARKFQDFNSPEGSKDTGTRTRVRGRRSKL